MKKKIYAILFILSISFISNTYGFGYGDSNYSIEDYFEVINTPTAINGLCSSVNGKSRVNQPLTDDRCTSGTASNVITTSTGYTWSCAGSNGGTNMNCEATILKPPLALPYEATTSSINWKWQSGGGIPTKYEFSNIGTGSYINKNLLTNHNEINLLSNTTYNNRLVKACDDIGNCSENLVLSGMTLNQIVNSGGGGGGSSISKINGLCSSVNGKSRVNQPLTGDRCTSGTASNVITTSTLYTWSCVGINGGTTANCSSTILKPPLALPYEATTSSINWKWQSGGGIPTKYEFSNTLGLYINKNLLTNQNETNLVANTNYTNRLARACDDIGNCSENLVLSGMTLNQTIIKDEPKPEDIETKKQKIREILRERYLKEKAQEEKDLVLESAPEEEPKDNKKPEKKEKTCEEPDELRLIRRCVFPNKNISFSDIEKSFAKDFILKLGNAGIVNGYTNTDLFKPENTISRAEYLKVVLRSFCISYQDVSLDNLNFKDVSKDSWEAKVIAKALEMGAIDGNKEYFNPDKPISRIEGLKIVFKLSKIIPTEVSVSEFSDLKEGTWEVKYVQKAKNMCVVDGGYDINGNLMFEPYKNMSRQEVSKVIYNMIKLK